MGNNNRAHSEHTGVEVSQIEGNVNVKSVRKLLGHIKHLDRYSKMLKCSRNLVDNGQVKALDGDDDDIVTEE